MRRRHAHGAPIPALLLLGSRFHPDTLDAVRSLEPGFVRLVLTHGSDGAGVSPSH